MWAIFKVFIEFVTVLLLFNDLIFLARRHVGETRDQACTPCIGRQSLNHWTTREVLISVFYLGFSIILTLLHKEVGRVWETLRKQPQSPKHEKTRLGRNEISRS